MQFMYNLVPLALVNIRDINYPARKISQNIIILNIAFKGSLLTGTADKEYLILHILVLLDGPFLRLKEHW